MSDSVANNTQQTAGGFRTESVRRHFMSSAGIVLAIGAGIGFLCVKENRASTSPPPQETRAVDRAVGSAHASPDSEFVEANKLASEFRSLHAVTPVPLTDLKTNPFRLRASGPEARRR